jgi:hypothetical protein
MKTNKYFNTRDRVIGQLGRKESKLPLLLQDYWTLVVDNKDSGKSKS